MSQNMINLDEGLKSFNINGDDTRVITFNPSDFRILERINNAIQNINAEMNNHTVATNVEVSSKELTENDIKVVSASINTIDTFIKNQIDYVFNAKVSDIVFGNQSPLSLVKGVPLYARFIEGVTPVIERELKIERAASEKRMSKYKSRKARK